MNNVDVTTSTIIMRDMIITTVTATTTMRGMITMTITTTRGISAIARPRTGT